MNNITKKIKNFKFINLDNLETIKIGATKFCKSHGKDGQHYWWDGIKWVVGDLRQTKFTGNQIVQSGNPPRGYVHDFGNFFNISGDYNKLQ